MSALDPGQSIYTVPMSLLLTDATLSPLAFPVIAASYVLGAAIFFIGTHFWLPRFIALPADRDLGLSGVWKSNAERRFYLGLFAAAAGVGSMLLNVRELPIFMTLLTALLGIILCVQTEREIHWSCHVVGALAMLGLMSAGFQALSEADVESLARSFMWTFAYGTLSRFYLHVRRRRLSSFDDLIIMGWLSCGLGDALPAAVFGVCLVYLLHTAAQRLLAGGRRAGSRITFPAQLSMLGPHFPLFLIFGLCAAHLLLT